MSKKKTTRIPPNDCRAKIKHQVKVTVAKSILTGLDYIETTKNHLEAAAKAHKRSTNNK